MFGFGDDGRIGGLDKELTAAPPRSACAQTMGEVPAKAKPRMLMTAFIVEMFYFSGPTFRFMCCFDTIFVEVSLAARPCETSLKRCQAKIVCLVLGSSDPNYRTKQMASGDARDPWVTGQQIGTQSLKRPKNT